MHVTRIFIFFSCVSCDLIHIELLGPTVGLDDPAYEREKTLWELYAYTPAHNYVPVVFLFDATGVSDTATSIQDTFTHTLQTLRYDMIWWHGMAWHATNM